MERKMTFVFDAHTAHTCARIHVTDAWDDIPLLPKVSMSDRFGGCVLRSLLPVPPSKTRPPQKRVSREGRGGGGVDEGHLESPIILEVSR